jgi:hypothetical protein
VADALKDRALSAHGLGVSEEQEAALFECVMKEGHAFFLGLGLKVDKEVPAEMRPSRRKAGLPKAPPRRPRILHALLMTSSYITADAAFRGNCDIRRYQGYYRALFQRTVVHAVMTWASVFLAKEHR